MMTLRTATMLVALLVVPTIAMFGMSWKPLVDSNDHKPSTAGIAKARPLGPAGPASWDGRAAPTPPTAPAATTVTFGQVRPVDAATRADNVAPPPTPHTAPEHAARQDAARAAGLDAAWFQDMEQRLRGQGATKYLLERWGSGGELYRFQCDVRSPVDGEPRHFEATATDAAGALQAVLVQIEAWRAELPR